MKYLWTFLLFVIFFDEMGAEEDLDFTKVDVAKLATHVYGTELLLLENSHYTEQTSYKFEDFFWTGSGDGPTDENIWTSDGPAIVYKTSTIISTVFVQSPSTSFNSSSTENSKCIYDCDATTSPSEEIFPTPTFTETPAKEGEDRRDDSDFFDAGRQFWLLTVLKSDGKDPIIMELKNSLSKLYKTAFQRQQAQHLGIVTRQKRTPVIEKPVNVYIHKFEKSKFNDSIEVLYHVEVEGKPVDAYTAANDMRLVTDEEVRRELGYPFVIKAEPYLKATEPLGLSKAKSTWFVIGISMMGVLLTLLVLAFLILGFAKKKRSSQPSVGIENRRHIFERGVGHENKGLVHAEGQSSMGRKGMEESPSPTYIKFGSRQTKASAVLRPQSATSRTSSSSSSLDISPLMNFNKKHKIPPKKPPRPRAALNKTVPINTTIRQLPQEIFDSDSSTSRKDDSPDMVFGENIDPGVVSPKSYLSMPSVKSFPRTNMPEPLTKVLEPVSVTHLDMPEEDSSFPPNSYRKYASETLVRHGSVGTVEDPGVIGPAVWNLHFEKLRHGVSVDQGINDLKHDLNPPSHISRMRRRFHDLLDDTFSLFGSSRKGSPDGTPVDDRSRPIAIEVKSHSAIDNSPDGTPVDDRSRPIAIEVKSHSAIDNRPNDLRTPVLRPRPKTTGAKKPDSHSSGPSCAWSSTAPSPLIRAMSAAPRITSAAPSTIHEGALSRGSTAPGEPSGLSRVPTGILMTPTAPRINVDHILAQGKFRPSDPAISVIEAIKTEIERISLPGSTTELNK